MFRVWETDTGNWKSTKPVILIKIRTTILYVIIDKNNNRPVILYEVLFTSTSNKIYSNKFTQAPFKKSMTKPDIFLLAM